MRITGGITFSILGSYQVVLGQWWPILKQQVVIIWFLLAGWLGSGVHCFIGKVVSQLQGTWIGFIPSNCMSRSVGLKLCRYMIPFCSNFCINLHMSIILQRRDKVALMLAFLVIYGLGVFLLPHHDGFPWPWLCVNYDCASSHQIH